MGLPPESALILLAAVYLGCEYGGRISSILLNIPGEASAVMTTLDGYPLAQQGKAGIALSISAWSSFVGGLMATIGVVLFAPLLAKWAVAVGPAEYFVLVVFAITCLAGMAGDKPLKTAMACCMGLFLSCIGIDSGSGVYRFTFGSLGLADGIQFVVLVLGLFSVSEILVLLERSHQGQKAVQASGRMLFNLKEGASVLATNLRSGAVGFGLGILPGAGATLASAVAYMSEKRLAKTDNRFGNGDLRGLAAPETANSASACGSMVPMLTLGVPGSGTTAVMLGALTLYNITPGPLLFQNQPEIVWGLIASLFIANLMLIVMNIPMIKIFTRILAVPSIGVYAVHATSFDLYLMIAIGVAGYLLRKLDFPLSAILLGFILGGLMEQSLRRALSISDGDLSILFASPITWGTWALVVLMAGLPIWRWVRSRLRSPAKLQVQPD